MLVGLALGGGLLVAWLFHRLRVPDVAGLVLYGVLVGPIWHFIPIRPNAPGLVNLLSLGAAFILFLGGRQISLTLLNRVKRTVTLLATLGVAITVVVLLMATHLLLGTSWPLSLGIAITMANTDPATIIPVMQRVRVKPLLRITVETEAAFNDVMSVLILTVLLIVSRHGVNGSALMITLAGLAVAAIGGLFLGRIARYLEPRLASYSIWLSRLVIVGTPVLAFFMAEPLGGAGLLAAFVAGIGSGSPELGDSAIPVEKFLSTGIRVVIFVLTGALLPFQFMVQHALLLLAVTGSLMVVARPLTVWAAAASQRELWRRNDRLFMMWVRETGAISVVLAMNLGQMYPESAHLILAVVAMSVVATVVIQATTTGWVAKKLKVT